MAAPMVHGTVTACGRLLLRFSSPLLRDIYGNGQNAMLKTKQTQRCLSISAARHRQQTKSTSSLSDKPYTEEFLQEMDQEYQLGKRHLANMMGEDPETFTQEDVDRAIRYLLPSGLHEKLARPMLKPPDQIFPKQKALQWGKERRPFSFLFYTGKANYYSLMHEAAQILTQLNRHEDKMLAKGVLLPDPEPWAEFNTSVWIDKIAVEKMITESMDDHQYRRFVEMLEHIAAHPYAKQAAQFILKFRQELVAVSMKQQVHPAILTGHSICSFLTEAEIENMRLGKASTTGHTDRALCRFLTEAEIENMRLGKASTTGHTDRALCSFLTEAEIENMRLGKASTTGHTDRALCSFLTEAEIENMRLGKASTTGHTDRALCSFLTEAEIENMRLGKASTTGHTDRALCSFLTEAEIENMRLGKASTTGHTDRALCSFLTEAEIENMRLGKASTTGHTDRALCSFLTEAEIENMRLGKASTTGHTDRALCSFLTEAEIENMRLGKASTTGHTDRALCSFLTEAEIENMRLGKASTTGHTDRALCSFLTEAEIENMRLAGLLTTDLRRKERKKPGQKRARKKFSWRKR
uniref:Uncharacterized protein n=1 Tax=Branchiostoma floridae TaxID=7739 RepID=C3ZWA4_BRAFL|eukprot:XP_002587166.1 hypothetical protein BRAFLDRAFT_128806 [Branchiostoma floridae]